MLHTLRQARAGVTNRLDEARKTNRKLAEAGFTLIELLIVIVILGILAAVVVFSVRGIQDKGQDAACKADVATLQTAEEAAYAGPDGGVYVGQDVLLSKGLITAQSAHYTITVTDNAKTADGYTITGDETCGSDFDVAVNQPAAGGGA